MTETTFPKFTPARTRVKEEVVVKTGTPLPRNQALESGTHHQRQNVTGQATTSGTAEVIPFNRSEAAPSAVDRIYPHLFDREGPAGEVRIYIQQALKDARLALESFGEADLVTVGTRLALITATMGKAHKASEFNPSLGGVISFIRRGTLTASSMDTTRAMLNALIYVLNSLDFNPMVDLEDAGNLVESLSKEGWRGEYELVNALISTLFENDADAEKQARLFDEVQTGAD